MKFNRKDWLYIAGVTVSAVIYSIGMNIFVKSGNLFPGGYAGISRLLSLLLDKYLHVSISFSVIYFTLNILTTLLVWKNIGHKFVLYSVLWYTETSLLTQILVLPEITNDPLLISVFGGVVNGIAVGIALRCNASSGGTDLIAVDLSARYNMPTWNYVFGLNAAVLTVAGLNFGWERALYSMIFQYVSKEVVNTLHQRYKLKSIHIVTDYPEEVSKAVFAICRHGITRVTCTGEYSHQQHYMLMATVNAYQKTDVINAVRSADPAAFISVMSVEKIVGSFYQAPLE
ncbi:MAG: YitT family protein [Erysipelotrichaceae bacterium]|jgi:uncharacterized membrane-anchored protein YitT (DUF2179 family)|nr:YitT family protein [Erysipelotrichaceae bacterium]MDO5108294.1 YitT family protein [Erysipelotrichaceae bacterium]